MKKLELLSPVGNYECLIAALEGGCDAVYLAGKLFGARAFAGNFSDEELIKAIKLCHLYGVRVYVTCNTIIYENEVERFIEYVEFLHKNNVDAIIMQDIGMFDLVRKTFPNLEIHISTQMHIHNQDGVKLMSSLGASRVVLARETSIEKIKEIKKNSNIELEVFIHGALCISYSGQCYMSTLIGSRSGNRGTCTQCCRMSYDVLDEEGNILNEEDKYPISTKELCTIKDIGKLIDIGVDSFKIEGRMKSSEYVYLITSLYRKAIDNYIKYKDTKINDEDIIRIKKMFNRNFAKGFLFNEDNNNFTYSYRPNHLGIEIGKVINYKNDYCYIELFNELNIGDGIRILSADDYGLKVNNFYIDKTLVKHASKGDIISLKINKKVDINSKVLLTYDSKEYSLINALIREKERRVPINISINCDCKSLTIDVNDNKNNVKLCCQTEKASNKKLTKEVLIEKLSKINDSVYKINNIDINLEDDVFISLSKLNDLKREFVSKLNDLRMYKTNYEKKDYYINLNNFEQVNKISNQQLKVSRVCDNYPIDNKHYLVGDLGAIYVCKDIDTDFSLNVTNSYSVAFLHSLGVKKICLSYELNYKQIKDLVDAYHTRYKKHPNLEVIVSGYEEAMISKYSLNKKYNKDILYLRDRFNNKFLVKTIDNIMYIYNYKKRNDQNNYYDIGINYTRRET